MDRAFENQDDPDLKPKISFKILSIEQLDELLENEDENVNPFWVRELRFEYGSANRIWNQLEEYWTKVIQLMERYGYHVHRINVDFDAVFITLEFQESLVRMLRATRNLRSLKVNGGVYASEKRLDELSDHFRTNLHQLPELSQLKHLSFWSSCVHWPGSLLTKLVADPAQLKSLSLMSLYGGQPSKEVALALRAFTNLKCLEIKGKLLEISQYLESVSTSRPPLERIRLEISDDDDDDEMDGPVFREVLLTLNSFSDSLKTLSLNAMMKKLPDGFDQGFPLPGVRLAKLQHLGLDNCEEVHTMVLLIEAPLKTLIMNLPDPLHEIFNSEHFDWRALGHCGSTLEELDVSGVGQGMNEHDFYALTINLPNLRIIKFQDINLSTLEHLFRLNSLKKLDSFHADFGRNSLEDSTRGFELVEQKLNGKPSIWEEMPFLKEFNVQGEIRPEYDDDQRARKRKVVTCVRGKAVEVRVLDRRYLA